MLKHFTTIVLLLLLVNGSSFAQESMMSAVSQPQLNTLIEYVKANYPRARKMRLAIEKQNYNIRRAKYGWFEALTFTYTYNPNAFAQSSTNPVNFFSTTQSGVFVNVGTLLEKSPQLKIAKTERSIAESELAEGYQLLEVQVKERYYNYIQQLTLLKIRSKYVEDAESSLKLVKYKFEKGEETFDNYTKALLLNSVAMQNRIDCEGNLLRSKAQLEELLGKKLEDVK
jgi:outer membrane protein TolC